MPSASAITRAGSDGSIPGGAEWGLSRSSPGATSRQLDMDEIPDRIAEHGQPWCFSMRRGRLRNFAGKRAGPPARRRARRSGAVQVSPDVSAQTGCRRVSVRRGRRRSHNNAGLPRPSAAAEPVLIASCLHPASSRRQNSVADDLAVWSTAALGVLSKSCVCRSWPPANCKAHALALGGGLDGSAERNGSCRRHRGHAWRRCARRRDRRCAPSEAARVCFERCALVAA